jgi:hypothetical protein
MKRSLSGLRDLATVLVSGRVFVKPRPIMTEIAVRRFVFEQGEKEPLTFEVKAGRGLPEVLGGRMVIIGCECKGE